MKGEKKKKSVEKCKGVDVKAIPENSIYLPDDLLLGL